jgi:hypothetical protein
MKEINLNMKSVEVKTTTRALRANWTSEMTSDLNSFHGLDTNLEEQLASMIRSESRKKSINKIWKSKN